MTTTEFILALVSALAWPSAIVASVLIIRRAIRKDLKR